MTELPGLPGPAEPAKPADAWDSGSLRSPLGRSATFMLAYIALLWAIDLINQAQGRGLNRDYGVRARDVSSLVDILPAQFLHGSVEHLTGNITVLYGLGLVAGLYGVWRLVGVIAVIGVVGGLGEWAISPSNSITVGASGIVFGLFGYLLARGVFDRRMADIVVAVGLGVAYASIIIGGLFPAQEQVSWQGHLMGLLGGIVAAFIFRRKREPKPATPEPPAIGETKPFSA